MMASTRRALRMAPWCWVPWFGLGFGLLALWLAAVTGCIAEPAHARQPSLLFADDFEGGDPCGWSRVVGGVECVREKTPSLCDFKRPKTETFRLHLSVRNEHGVDACTSPLFSRDTWDRFCAPNACAECSPDLSWSCS